jgi:uncharacterized membrane protein YeaQ/YmgE (transglycosylase-associated protein family)
VARSPRVGKKPDEGEEHIDPMMLPPKDRSPSSAEPEEGSRWLHFLAGLIVGFFLGAACAKFLWRRFGIVPVNTMAISSLVVAAVGAVLRGKLWRWLKL